MEQQCGQRIVIIGSSGSGKTTLAKKIAAELGIPHIELDAIHWQDNWKKPSQETFREWVSTALQGDRWVVDGNYAEVRDITFERGDTLLWLDYPVRVVWSRLGRRTFKRLIKRQLLLNKNRKTWREQYLNRHSQFFYLIRTYRKRRRQYHTLLRQPEYPNLIIFRLRSQRETDRWFRQYIRQSAPKSRRFLRFRKLE